MLIELKLAVNLYTMYTSSISVLFSIWLLIINSLVGGPEIASEVVTGGKVAFGLETPYSIKIQTHNIHGLAQLKFITPIGLFVDIAGTHSAQVTRKEGVLSLLWEDLDVPEIEINLVMRPEKGFQSGVIISTMSYLKDNQRSDCLLSNTEISSFINQNDNYSDQNESGVSCTRIVTQENDGVALVDLIVDGEGFDGFLKLTEHIPDNCIIEIVNPENSLAQVGDELLTFVWFDATSPLPITVSYRLLGCSVNDTREIMGDIDYAFGKTGFSKHIAQEESYLVSENTPLNETPIVEEPKSKPVQKDINKSVMSPDNGVSFRVQILAGHNDVNSAWISKRYNFAGNSDVERHEGWIKYTTGSFSAYHEARNEREDLNKTINFPQPFVTAYYDGERISVEEALTITQQEWLP